MPKATARRTLQRYALKAAVFLSGLLATFYLPYLILGLWNRCFGGWKSVFYCYAGSSNYIDAYSPGVLTQAYRWFPVPIGILKHDGAYGLVIASSASEEDFLNPANIERFKRMQRRIRLIAKLMGVQQINLAGILPGIVHAHDTLDLRDNRPIVQRAVCAAAQELVRTRFSGKWPSVILIGGAGHVGKPVAQALKADGRDVHVIDPRMHQETFPDHLQGTSCLVIDISRKGVIDGYIPHMWSRMVLLNETFPRPPRKTLAALAEQGVEAWHLSGLAGSITPPLPFGYENAVPCCAAHDACEQPDVRLVQLTNENPKQDSPTKAVPYKPACVPPQAAA